MEEAASATALPQWARPLGDTVLPDALLAQALAGLSVLRDPPARAPQPGPGVTLRGHYTTAPVATLLAWCATDALTDTTWILARWVAIAVKAAHENGLHGEMESAIYNGCLAVRQLDTNGQSDLDAALHAVQACTSLQTAHACVRTALKAGGAMALQLGRLERLFAFATQTRSPHPGTSSPDDGSPDASRAASPAPGVTDAVRKDGESRLPRATPTEIGAIRSHVQDLAFADPTALHAYDWQCLLESMDKASPAVRAVVGAVLSSGLGRADLAKCKVVASVCDVPGDCDEPCYAVAENAWLVRNAVNPLYKDGSDRDAARWLVLPLQAWGRGAAGLKSHVRQRIGRPLFTRDELTEASLHMRRLRESTECSVTLRRMAGAVRQGIRDLSGDRSAAACVFGFNASAQARSPWHYRQAGTDWIAGVHSSAGARVQGAMGCAGAPRSFETLSIERLLIGSHRVPDPEAVSTWAATARATIEAAPRGRPSLAKIASFHNDFVLYTLHVLLWATGVRPTEEGLASVLPHGGRVLADEKRKRQRAVRALPLSPIAARQWSLYLRHHAWLADRYDIPRVGWFTLELDADGAIVCQPLDVARMARMSRSPFEDNAHRHALATGLFNRGWPAHRINLWLGHAGLGEEPGTPHSAHEPDFAADELADIDAVLEAHGWQACEGLGRG